MLADRYRLENEVGLGGMATVYLAYDLRHDRKVAVKVLRPELAAIIGGIDYHRRMLVPDARTVDGMSIGDLPEFAP